MQSLISGRKEGRSPWAGQGGTSEERQKTGVLADDNLVPRVWDEGIGTL